MVKVLGWIISVLLLAAAFLSAWVAVSEHNRLAFVQFIAFLFLALFCNPPLRNHWLVPQLGKRNLNIAAFVIAACVAIAGLWLYETASAPSPAASADATDNDATASADNVTDDFLPVGAVKAGTEQEAGYDSCAAFTRQGFMRPGHTPDTDDNQILVSGTRGEGPYKAQCFREFIRKIDDYADAVDKALVSAMNACSNAGFQCRTFGTLKDGLRDWAEDEKKKVLSGVRNPPRADRPSIDSSRVTNLSDGGMASLEEQ